MSLNRRLALGIALGVLLVGPARAPAADDPPKVAGTWSWKWKDAQGETHSHVLEVEGAGDKLAARERYDEEAAVKVDDLKLAGKKISFAVNRKGRHAEYKGTVDSADTINGVVVVVPEGGQPSEFGWTAKREAGGK